MVNSTVKVTRVPSTESEATLGTTKCTAAENNWSQESIICELTRRLGEREAELRAVLRQKTALESKKSTGKKDTADMERAYESLMAHLAEREESFKFLSQKNEHLLNRQNELDRVTRELHETLKFQRLMMKEKDDKISRMQRQFKEKEKENDLELSKVRQQLTLAHDMHQEELIQKNETLEKLAFTEDTVRQMVKEIDQYIQWQHEAAAKVTAYEKTLEIKGEKISELESNIYGFSTEIERLRSKATEDKLRVEKLERDLNLSREDVSDLHDQVDILNEKIAEQKKIVHIYEKRFATKGQNILELNAKADKAEKLWSKIEEREEKFRVQECTMSLLREENDHLIVEGRKLQSDIDELKDAFELHKLHFAGENVDMPFFLSKLRETVKLNNRITELEKIVEDKGYISDVAKAVSDLREKERKLSTSTDTLFKIIEILKKVLNDDDVNVPKIIGKFEESLLLFSEITGSAVQLSNDDLNAEIVLMKSNQTADSCIDDEQDEIDDDDTTLNSHSSKSKYINTRCDDLKQFNFDKKDRELIFEFVQNIRNGLLSIKKEGMWVASDFNAFCGPELDIDERDECETHPKGV